MRIFKALRLHRLFGLGVVVAFAATSAQAQQLPNAKLILDWAYQGQNSALTMAEDKGWYKEFGANVSVSRGYGSGDTVSKVASGAFQIGYADTYVLLRFLGQNPDQHMKCFYMSHERSALSIAVPADSPITNPHQLVGKRIASPVGDASRQVFPLFAAKNGIKESDIKWMNVTPALRVTMFVQRNVDAISGSMNTIIMNLAAVKVPQEKVRFFPYADYGLPLYGHCLFTTDAFAEKNPKVLTAVVRGVVRGMRAMLSDPKMGAEMARKRDPLLVPEVEERRIQISADLNLATPNVKKYGFGYVDIKRLSDTIDDVSKIYDMKRPVRVNDIYTDKYLPPREELRFKADAR
jgi:NitT/TauT family transport system substrate-binding protein